MAQATPMRVDLPIRPEVLREIRFCDRRGVERGLPLVDGRLARATSIQGHVYRLSPSSASQLATVVAEAAPGPPPP